MPTIHHARQVAGIMQAKRYFRCMPTPSTDYHHLLLYVTQGVRAAQYQALRQVNQQ